MWIKRSKENTLKKIIEDLTEQVLIVRGARQVGKSALIKKVLKDNLSSIPYILINFLYAKSTVINNETIYGIDFFGNDQQGEILLKNLQLKFNDHSEIIHVFIDEVDRYPLALEAIQNLALHSKQYKFIFTGSNLENLNIENVATGRKKFFDIYPLSFLEFLEAAKKDELLEFVKRFSLKNTEASLFYHNQLSELFQTYTRLGGMPKILDYYFDKSLDQNKIPEIISDLVTTIEENVKTVLGNKISHYQYHDVLRTMANLSLNTLKYNKLQVQHAGKGEAKNIVGKTVGARVAHKIRLFSSETDLSKYIIFDSGVLNYLLNGSELLTQKISTYETSIMLETAVGLEIINQLINRDDLFYWKSETRAEIEFMLRSPCMTGIDVKTNTGKILSLNSFAMSEDGANVLIKMTANQPKFIKNYQAKLPNAPSLQTKKIPLLELPHYLACKIPALLKEI